MDIKLETNIEEVAGALRDKAGNLEAAEKKAMSNAIRSLFVTSKNQLTQLVYQKEIPRRKRSRKIAWRRSYDLLKAERFRVSTKGETGEVFTDPSSRAHKYAAARHELDRPSPIDGKVRRAPWRKEAYTRGINRAIDRYREALSKDFE